MIKFFTLLILAIGILSCTSNHDKLTGGTVDTGNPSISGTVTSGDNPAEGVVVSIYSKDHNPVTGESIDTLQDTTNTEGEYSFYIANAGTYFIIAQNPTDTTVGLAQTVLPENISDTLISVPEIELETPGVITVNIKEFNVEEKGYIYLPGSNIFQQIDSTDIQSGIITLTDVPPAFYSEIIYINPDDSTGSSIVEDTIQVHSDSNILLEGYNAWPGYRKIKINPPNAGIDIPNPLNNFPFLVRLDSNNFDFTQTQPNGEDIRFTKPNGSSLLYEIDRWSLQLKTAEIWVQIDTVFSNDTIQYLNMHWGDSTVESKSKGSEVFSNNSFLGVWHLSETVSNATAKFFDASPYTFDLNGIELNPGADTSAIIGNGLTCDDSLSRLDGPSHNSLALTKSLTIEAWHFRADTTKEHQIAFYGRSLPDSHPEGELEGNNKLYVFFVGLNGKLNLVWEYENGIDEKYISTVPVNTPIGNWMHIAVVRNDNTKQLHFYENGKRLGDSYTYTNPPTGGENGFLTVGRHCNGGIDEVRISNTARPRPWMELGHFNQKLN